MKNYLHPCYQLCLLRIALFTFLSMSHSIAMTNESPKKEILFSGEINPTTVEKFISENKEDGIEKLKIFSLKGELHSAIRLGKWVKERGLDVEAHVMCYSACATYVFPAGVRKTIGPGALVMWHGTMEQKNFREIQAKYEELEAKQAKSAVKLNDEEINYLAEKRAIYEGIKAGRAAQSSFFSQLGVDEYIGRLGQEPIRYPSESWAASVKVMSKFGISNVTADPRYGTLAYMKRNPFAAFISKGPLLSFDLSETGEVIPISK